MISWAKTKPQRQLLWSNTGCLLIKITTTLNSILAKLRRTRRITTSSSTSLRGIQRSCIWYSTLRTLINTRRKCINWSRTNLKIKPHSLRLWIANNSSRTLMITSAKNWLRLAQMILTCLNNLLIKSLKSLSNLATHYSPMKKIHKPISNSFNKPKNYKLIKKCRRLHLRKYKLKPSRRCPQRKKR